MIALIPVRTSIEEIKLNDKQIMKIWYETDLQHPCPNIHYEITRAKEVIVPATRVVVWGCKPPHDVQVAFAQDGTLVCVYDSELWDHGFLILYNTQTGEACPGASRCEDWKIPYAQLRAENPSLPEVIELMIDDE